MLHLTMKPDDVIAEAMRANRAVDPGTPQVGDLFPDIWADSTEGGIEFHAWARGHYTIFFSHASAYSDVAEADMVALARMAPDFAARGARLIGVAQSDAGTERLWLDELELRSGVEIAIPVMADEDGRIAEICGIDTQGRRPRMPMGKTFVIGPNLRTLAISSFPAGVRRSPRELLRVLDAMRGASLAA